MEARTRRAILVPCITLWVVLGPAAAGTALAGDFKRFPDYAYEARQDVDIEALKVLLREAQELQKAEDAGLAEKTVGEGEQADPTAPDAGDGKHGQPAPAIEKRAAAAAAAAELRGSNQAGCMYRDLKLIWEKTPGSCKPQP